MNRRLSTVLSLAPTLTLLAVAWGAAPSVRAQTTAPAAAASAPTAAQKSAIKAKRAALGAPAPRAPTQAEAKIASVKKKAAAYAAAQPEAAAEARDELTEGQLQAASRVLLGEAECEFRQTVMVEPIAERPGHFKVAFNKVSYVMVPEETTTGAVRLVDQRAGVVWLQIPVKSMLMNHKIGQRLVDSCRQADQRAAVAAAAAVTSVGPSLGIDPQLSAQAAALPIATPDTALPSPGDTASKR